MTASNKGVRISCTRAINKQNEMIHENCSTQCLKHTKGSLYKSHHFITKIPSLSRLEASVFIYLSSCVHCFLS